MNDTMFAVGSKHTIRGTAVEVVEPPDGEVVKVQCVGETDGRARWYAPVGEMRRALEHAALVDAIRTFTVEAPDDKPNGRAEAAMLYLSVTLDPKSWPGLTDEQRAVLDQANGAAAVLCSSLADDTKVLREAAEAFFGGDFRKPAGDV